MPIDLAAVIIVLIASATGVWLLGYRYGYHTVKSRHANMLDALRQHQKDYPLQPDNWNEGYVAGCRHTMETLEAFIEKTEKI